MKTRLLLFAGLCLLAGTIVGTMLRGSRPGAKEGSRDARRSTLRFAHWNLHGGFREAYDRIIADYERLHPDVKIEQLAVPVRVWPSWQRTRLVGGTITDIVQLGRGTDDEVVSRYFIPLTAATAQPNGYNRGTPLEGARWRDTFIDGLTSENVYYPNLQEIYGIPTLLMNMRAFYNRTLLEKIAGSPEPPRDYVAFTELMRRADAWDASEHVPLVPIAGSSDYATHVFHRLLTTQTQRELLANDTQRTLMATPFQLELAYQRGGWSLRSAGLQNALTIYQELGRHMPPGFLQLKRDDALFAFAQGKSLVLLSGAWDYSLLLADCRFPIVVAPLPLPDERDPRFGSTILGLPPETSNSLDAIYGVARSSPHPEIAVDFLRFLTSCEVGTRFAGLSQRLPATVEVALPSHLEPLALRTEGALGGFSFNLSQMPELRHWLQTNAFRLFAPGASVVDFTRATEDAFSAAVAAELRRMRDTQIKTTQRGDTVLLAQLFSNAAASSKAPALATTQVMREFDLYQLDAAAGGGER